MHKWVITSLKISFSFITPEEAFERQNGAEKVNLHSISYKMDYSHFLKGPKKGPKWGLGPEKNFSSHMIVKLFSTPSLSGRNTKFFYLFSYQ